MMVSMSVAVAVAMTMSVMGMRMHVAVLLIFCVVVLAFRVVVAHEEKYSPGLDIILEETSLRTAKHFVVNLFKPKSPKMP